MADFKPDNLVLRCYGHQTKDGKYYGACLELNLAAEAESFEQLKDKLKHIIVSYIETVLDSDDKESIPSMLCRRAPMMDWFKYYLICLEIFLKKIPHRFIFKESIPFRLAAD